MGLLIINVAFTLGSSCKTLRETLIHNSMFIYLGESGYQISVKMSSFPGQEKKNSEEGGRGQEKQSKHFNH